MDAELEAKINAKFQAKSREIRNRAAAIYLLKGMKQKDIAEKLGKKPSEISKWLSGEHNLTIKSIMMLEVILEEDIIFAPKFDYCNYKRNDNNL